jgi:mannonate dehydratase
LPVYKLLGGKVRTAVPLYTHASAKELPELEDQVRKAMEAGYRHVRVQLAVPRFSGYGVNAKTSDEVQRARPSGVAPSPVFEPTPYVNNTVKMFDYLRAKIGFDVDLIHDVHERIPPTQALSLAKAVEPFRLFYLEDALAPEDVPWFQTMRAQTATPLAMGELFVNRNEWLPLVANRWDRLHPLPYLRHWRLKLRTQDRRHLRNVWCENCLAWTGKCLARWTCREYASGLILYKFRHSGGEPI